MQVRPGRSLRACTNPLKSLAQCGEVNTYCVSERRDLTSNSAGRSATVNANARFETRPWLMHYRSNVLILRSYGIFVCFIALRAPADDRMLAEADLAATLVQICGVYSWKLLTSEEDTEGSL